MECYRGILCSKCSQIQICDICMVCHGERIVMTSEGRQRTDETGGWRMAEYTKCYTCDGSGKMSPKKRAERIEELARLKEQSKKESEDD